MDPLVSVIIPNYRHAPYLDERIKSVLNQTYSNIEVIILDDHSPDNSLDVINKYKNDSKIAHIIANEVNSGSTFKQWEKGFELAKGEYIWIAESDDVAENSFLSQLMQGILENKDIVLAYSASHIINQDGDKIASSDGLWKKSFVKNGHSFVKTYMLGRNHIYNASAVVFKKSVLTNIQPTEYSVYKASGDRMFWSLVCLQGNVYYHAEKLNYFRKHNLKVSPKAATSGKTMLEDYDIYIKLGKLLSLNLIHRILACGYQYGIIKRCPFEKGAKHLVMEKWGKECSFSFVNYIIYRIFVKLIFK